MDGNFTRLEQARSMAARFRRAGAQQGQGGSDMNSTRTLARVAGLLYLLMLVGATFAGYVRSRIVESGDPAATADNIRASATLFRVGFVADLVQATLLLLAAMALYLLLRHVNQLVAQAMVTFVAVAVAIYSLNLLNQFTALRIATDQGYARAFGRAGSDQLVLQFADMQHNGYYLAAMFFGLWLLPLGYLVITSGYLPKVLGVSLIIGGVGYLVDLLVRFLAPGFGAGVSPLVVPGAVAELSLAVWLLVKAVPVPVPHADVPIPVHAGRGS
jgi:hypothetical protein